MLCRLAKRMPVHIAGLLERDAGLTRNFREETITDVLMASFIGLGSLQIKVDFPNETQTGADMEWIFIGPGVPNGVKCLRILLQAKRAAFLKSFKGYWLYKHLDHQDGQQAATLMRQQTKPSVPIPTVPMYIFYHPTSALAPKTSKLPAVEGVNIVFAHDVAAAVSGGCGNKERKLEKWRPQFLSLADVLCWPSVVSAHHPTAFALSFMSGDFENIRLSGGFHPNYVVQRLKRLSERVGSERSAEGRLEYPTIVIPEPSDTLPPDIERAISGQQTPEDKESLVRPRVIFNTDLSEADPRIRDVLRRGRT